ncbi:MAG: hypothetical protein LH616_00310 [Ilumatobacteraceae bacterium]|nr:hypothetical protein [Ilumatobacteraceae bacterium]
MSCEADNAERASSHHASSESAAVMQAARILEAVASEPFDVTHDTAALRHIAAEVADVIERAIEITTKAAVGVGLKGVEPLAAMDNNMPATLEHAPANLLDAARLMASAHTALHLALVGLAGPTKGR